MESVSWQDEMKAQVGAIANLIEQGEKPILMTSSDTDEGLPVVHMRVGVLIVPLGYVIAAYEELIR